MFHYMVYVKTMLKHANVCPVKCVVYVSRNPIMYSIDFCCEYFVADQKACNAKAAVVEYKRHVHQPPKNNATADQTEVSLIADVTRLQPFTISGSVADPRFSPGGGANSQKPIIFQFFWLKTA